MKKRHLLLGFSVVLVLSLAVPALGAGGLAGVKALAKKALAAANGAQSAAGNAQQAAGNAQDAAKTAQNMAGAAQSVAGAAQAKANAAQAAAEGAQGAAGAAQTKANSAQGAAGAAQSTADAANAAANAAQGTANAANAAAAGKFGSIVRPAAVVAHNTGVANIKEGTAVCDPGQEVISGGYQFTAGTAEVHVDKLEGNGWRVQAQAPSDPYEFSVFVYCLVR